MRYFARVFVLLALTTPARAGAQGDSLAAGLAGTAATQMAALAHLGPNNTVRVHVLGQGWVSGPVIRNEADSLVLSSASRERAVPTAAIDSVLVRHGHAGIGAGLGALIGMIVGASAGGCEQPPARSLGEAAGEIGDQISCGVGHMMAGLAVGAVVGALIGEATPSWEQRVPREVPTPDAP